MTGEDAVNLWIDTGLRYHVLQCVNKYKCSDKLSKCLIAKAWEILSKTERGKTERYYKKMIEIVVKREYNLYRYGEKKLY